MKETINIRHDYFFPKKARIMIFGFSLILLLPTIGSGLYLASLIISLTSAYFLFLECGNSLNPPEKSYRNYTGVLGIYWGKWGSYEHYTDISLLNLRYKANASFAYFFTTNVIDEKIKEIYILTSDHRKRILIKPLSNTENPEEQIDILAKSLGLKISAYSPQISAKTASRRRR